MRVFGEITDFVEEKEERGERGGRGGREGGGGGGVIGEREISRRERPGDAD